MLSSVVICAGEDTSDASLHSDPACVSGCPVGSEDESLLSGAAICAHSHHSSAHVHDRHSLFRHGDEMCKYLSASVTFTPKPRDTSLCYLICGFL